MAEDVSDEAFAEPEGETLTFEVSEAEAGGRLDSFLAARVADVSRTTLKRLVEDGDALVNGRASKPSYKLHAGDQVEVELAAPPSTELLPEDIPLDIVYEDEEVVVVNKPAGMVVHPAAGVRSGTLANALAFRLRKAEGGRRIDEQQDAAAPGDEVQTQRPPTPPSAISTPQSLRPGIVHRLDRDTSGLMVVAKTARAHEHLSKQFHDRKVFKSYATLVHGRVARDDGRVAQPLMRDPRQRTRMAVRAGGREALSLWRVRRRYDRFTLLDVEIKTGRTHQIRVHMAWLKHPVVGDEVYGGGRDKTVPEPAVRARISALGRQFLHAERLGFRHPRDGRELRFQAPLPADLQAFLDELEKNSSQ